MVHLFTIQGRYKSFSCLARLTNGVYAVESIDGHPADVVPSMVLTRAKQKVATMQHSGKQPSPVTVTSVLHNEVEAAEMVDAFATDFDNMKW